MATTTAIERCKLYLHVIDAKEVMWSDRLTKTSDPFVKITGSGLLCESISTDVKKKTVNPTWDEKFTPDFTYKLNQLKMKVYDYDVVGSKDPIGKVIFPVAPYLLDGEEHEYNLPILVEKKGTARRYKGVLHFKIRAEWKFPILKPNTWLQCNERKIVIGLGWDISKKIKVDLDASVAALDAANMLLGAVSFKNLKAFNGAITHSGDNTTGEGDGDDERVTVDFALMPPNVEKLIVVINSFSGVPFMNVKSAYFRVSSPTQGTQGFYRLSDMSATTGMFMGAFFLNRANGLWFFQAIGKPVGGRILNDSMPNVINLLGGIHL